MTLENQRTSSMLDILAGIHKVDLMWIDWMRNGKTCLLWLVLLMNKCRKRRQGTSSMILLRGGGELTTSDVK